MLIGRVFEKVVSNLRNFVIVFYSVRAISCKNSVEKVIGRVDLISASAGEIPSLILRKVFLWVYP